MKRTLFACLTLFFTIHAYCQNPSADSILRLMKTSPRGLPRHVLMNEMLYNIHSLSQQERIVYAQKVLDLAIKDRDLVLQSIITAELGYVMAINGNLLEGTELVYEALEMGKKIKSDLALAVIYNDLGICFRHDTVKSISLFKSGLQHALLTGDHFNTNAIILNLAKAYSTPKYKDSALYYAQKAYEFAITNNVIAELSSAFLRLGLVHYYLLGNKEIGLEYVKKAMNDDYAQTHPDTYLQISTSMAHIYENENQLDTALHYTHLSAIWMDKARYTSTPDVYELYKNIYSKINADSAVKYYRAYEKVKDSISRLSGIQQQLLLSIKKEIEFEKAALRRKINLQYMLIAVGILVFISFFIIISKRYITHTGLIRFMGVIALLLIFEFLNLLLHPFLERVTGHSPVLILLAMVAIAALLIPLHHRLEKWAIHKILEKNKKARLHHARKTIEKLGET